MTARSLCNFPVAILINYNDCHCIVTERLNKICLVLLGGTIFKVGNLAHKPIENFDPAAAPFRKYRGYGAKPDAENFG